MKTKKLLSILLALMMMLSVVPMYASAAEPITLTTSNIAIVPPSVSPGEMLYGDAWSTLTITGGELYYIAEDGTETLVPGHFEHYKADGMPAEGDNRAVPFNFVSEDTTKFTSIQRLQSGRVTVKSGTWPTINVVAGRVRPTITEAPTPVNAKPGMLWGEVTFTGGKAEYEGTNVEGTFIIEDSYSNLEVAYGSYGIKVKFVPTDTQTYLSSGNFNLTVTVKRTITFVDSNGTETVPEITVPYGTKLKDGDMAYYISQAGCTVVAGKDGCYYGATDADGYIFGTSASGEAPEVGTHYYEFIARPYTTVGVTSYYEETVLKLKVNVTPLEAEMKLDTTPIKGTDGLELWVWHKDTSIAANPQGTFTVYLDGAVYKENVKYGEHFTWQPAESKAYEFKATYTPVENDPFSIADFILTRDIKLTRKLTASENILSGYGDFKYGTTVEISANLTSENFAGWKITDAQGNEVTLDGIDNSSRKITITMPDYDIHVEALEKGATGGDDSTGGIFDGLGDLIQGDSDNPIVNIFNNIIAWFKNIINTIIELFRSIGDNS